MGQNFRETPPAVTYRNGMIHINWTRPGSDQVSIVQTGEAEALTLHAARALAEAIIRSHEDASRAQSAAVLEMKTG